MASNSRESEEFVDLMAMPTTAYLVLGVLKVLDERLTAGEIRARAEHTLGRIYWSPAVSHIRRELSRLLKLGLVSEESVESGQRAITVYSSTNAGEQVLRDWVGSLSGSEDPVLKHPLMLRIWLAQDGEHNVVIASLDAYIERLEREIQKAQWAIRRGIEVGRHNDESTRYPHVVMNYSLRSLYSELSNIRQTRDEIHWILSDRPPLDLNLPTSEVRRRQVRGAKPPSNSGEPESGQET